MYLINLLGKYKLNDKDLIKTHTIIPNQNHPEYIWGGTYHIPMNLSDSISTEFHDYFFNHSGKLSFTEAIPDITPLYIDMDFHFDGTNKSRQYDIYTINNIVKFLFKYIQEYFKIDNIQEELCYIHEKEHPKKNKEGYVIKDGLHVLFPNIIGDKLVFKEFIRLLSLKSDSKVIINNCISKPINSISNIFDTNVQRWFIYGSTKPDDIPYTVTHVYRYLTEIENTLSDKELLKLFYLTKEYEINIEYKNEIDNILIKKNIIDNKDGINIMSSLDLINDLSNEDFVNDEEKDLSIEVVNTLKEDKIKSIEKIVMRCLSPDRYNSYELWIKSGLCLKNISPDLFNIWNKFSKQADAYDSKADCLKKWESFGENYNNPMTEGTLHYWAKLDNPDEYKIIIEESLDKLINQSVVEGGTHDDIARVVFEYFKDEYVCADLKSNLWYKFNGTLWKPCKNGYLLQNELPSRIKLIYDRARRKYMDLQNIDPNDKNHDTNKEKADKIYSQLKNVPFQKNIMEACKNKFYSDDFHETMDSNTKLLCFENCIFDLNKNMLREGRPEDKLTISTNYKLPILPNELPMDVPTLWKNIQNREGIIEKDWKTVKQPSKKFKERATQIKKFLLKVLPNLSDLEETPGEIRGYCLKYIASRLCGNVSNRFSIWTGSGGNGKSVLLDLIRYTLGEYCMNIPVTLLTQKRKASNSACPEKARTRGARLCYMQEPDENEKINAGEMKELSGGDMILARNLYQEPFEFKPQFEIVLMCNDKPRIEDKTNGAWRRVQVYPFNSRFVDEISQVDHDKHVYKADKQLQDIVPDWNVIFMGLLLNEWCSMGSDSIDVPKSIRMETENYKNQNDIIGQWFNDQVIECMEETTSFRDLCNYYESWLELVYGKNMKIDKLTFKERLISWQKQQFGFSDAINGSVSNPKINMIIKEE